jgi:hypothetical protein
VPDADLEERHAACRCDQLSRPAAASPCGCRSVIASNARDAQEVAFSAQARFPSGRVIIAGEHRTFARTVDSGKVASCRLCPTCGSTIAYENQGMEDLAAIPLGAFADPYSRDPPSPYTRNASTLGSRFWATRSRIRTDHDTAAIRHLFGDSDQAAGPDRYYRECCQLGRGGRHRRRASHDLLPTHFGVAADPGKCPTRERLDLEALFARIAPEDPGAYAHDDERANDMPARLRTALPQVQPSSP